MSLAELEQQPAPAICFDPRFMTPNYNPKIIDHEGVSTRVHDTNSLPLILNTHFLLESGIEPQGIGKDYGLLIQSEPVMQAALLALRENEDLYMAAAYAVYLHNQEYDEVAERLRSSEDQEVVAHQGINPASMELRAQKDYSLSCVYVFLADKARQLDPAFDIDNFRN